MAYNSSAEPFDDSNLWETDGQNSLATVFRGDMKLGCEKNTAFSLVSEHEDNGNDDPDDDDEGEEEADEDDEEEEGDFDDDFDEDFDDDDEEDDDDDDEPEDDLEVEE